MTNKKPFDGILSKSVLALGSMAFFGLICLGLAYIYLEINLPDVETLKDVHFQEPLRIYSKDGKLIEEYGSKRRIPINIEDVPQDLINAILATEDQRFFEHPGIDLPGLIRAAMAVIKSGEKKQGASTITMQVARNFFLSRKKTFARKLNEILLAIKIDKELPKEKILELYLNKIYFGQGAYGVAAAAKIYYNRELKDLSLAQNAMLAGLPQAPSRINPIANPKAALKRRHHVLNRMLDENVITKKQYENAIDAPITARYHKKQIELYAPHAAETIRNVLYNHLGDMIYTSGYKVYATIESKNQVAANNALVRAIDEYDKRHGYRGVLGNEPDYSSIKWDTYKTNSANQLAVVLYLDDEIVEAILPNEETITLSFKDMHWARKALSNGRLGPKILSPREILDIGDIIHVTQARKKWKLSQLPEVEGGLVSINPKTDEVLALAGGYDYNLNKYNHVTQAKRQPGSSFKPFIYAAALEKGYSLNSKFNDAPIVKQDQSQDNLIWRPQNHNHRFTGITSIREALMRSKNLVTIRILESIGIDYALNVLTKFGFAKEDLPASLSLALGSSNLTAIDLAAAYSALANDGLPSKPFLISKIYNAKGNLIFEKHASDNTTKEQAISKQVAYLVTSVLKDTITQGGTGRLTKMHLNRSDIAGKTGTTNSHKDTWYAGFNPNVVAVSWMGYDKPRSLHEYSWKSALPIWLYYMKEALKGTPEQDSIEPEGIIQVRIDPKTGLLANSEQSDSFFELFREDKAPKQYAKHISTENQQESDYLF